MTKHYNPSITDDALRTLNSKQGDYLSDEVAGPVAVIPITPVADVVLSATNTGTIVTLSSSDDFYITSLSLGGSKLVADTGTALTISATINGVSRNLLQVRGGTLALEGVHGSQSFYYPIKVDRGSTITLLATGTWQAVAATVTGYSRRVAR